MAPTTTHQPTARRGYPSGYVTTCPCCADHDHLTYVEEVDTSSWWEECRICGWISSVHRLLTRRPGAAASPA